MRDGFQLLSPFQERVVASGKASLIPCRSPLKLCFGLRKGLPPAPTSSKPAKSVFMGWSSQFPGALLNGEQQY